MSNPWSWPPTRVEPPALDDDAAGDAHADGAAHAYRADEARDSIAEVVTAVGLGLLAGIGWYHFRKAQKAQKAAASARREVATSRAVTAAAPPAGPPMRRNRKGGKKARARVASSTRVKSAAPPPPPPSWADFGQAARVPPPLVEEQDAARLLGVHVDASEDVIRGAYRRKVREEMRTGGFGDQADDEERTRRINDAKNRLMERARMRRAVSR